MKIAMIGTGYVGLVSGVCFSDFGHEVVCVDKDPRKLEMLGHPELNTVEKILERPDLFPSVEDPSKGAFMGCPAGWSCQLSNANLFRAFDMEAKGWVLIDPGSAAGLDGAIAKASERGEPWFGYYWSPTAVIGKYKMQKLEWETPWAGDENWEACIAKPEQECLDPQKTSYSASAVNSVVASEFLERGGAAADYIKARVFPGSAMNEMLVFMTENQASGEDAAYEFLDTMEDVWTQWVPADVAEKVKKGL